MFLYYLLKIKKWMYLKEVLLWVYMTYVCSIYFWKIHIDYLSEQNRTSYNNISKNVKKKKYANAVFTYSELKKM